MDIEKLIKEQAGFWIENNYLITKKMAEFEEKVIEDLRKVELSKIFVNHSDLRAIKEVDNVERAYEEGFKNGLKYINIILNMGEMEKSKLKEAVIEKRAS